MVSRVMFIFTAICANEGKTKMADAMTTETISSRPRLHNRNKSVGVEIPVIFMNQHIKHLRFSHKDTQSNILSKLLFPIDENIIRKNFKISIKLPKESEDSPEIIDVDDVTFEQNLDECQGIYINEKKSDQMAEWDGFFSKQEVYDGAQQDQLIGPDKMEVSVFWDIENCKVPGGKGSEIIARLIDVLCKEYKKVHIFVVCKFTERHLAKSLKSLKNVDISYVSCSKANIADDKIKNLILKQSEKFQAIVIISGDIDFTSTIFNLKYKKRIPIYVVHKDIIEQELLTFTTASYSYGDIIKNLPNLTEVSKRNCDITSTGVKQEQGNNERADMPIFKVPVTFHNVTKCVNITPGDCVNQVKKQILFLTLYNITEYEVIVSGQRTETLSDEASFGNLTGCKITIKPKLNNGSLCKTSEIINFCSKLRPFRQYVPNQPHETISVLWDLVSCPIPECKNACEMTKLILDKFCNGYKLDSFRALNEEKDTPGMFTSVVDVFYTEDLQTDFKKALDEFNDCSKTICITSNPNLILEVEIRTKNGKNIEMISDKPGQKISTFKELISILQNDIRFLDHDDVKKMVVFDNTHPLAYKLRSTPKGGGYIEFDKDTNTAMCIFKDINIIDSIVLAVQEYAVAEKRLKIADAERIFHRLEEKGFIFKVLETQEENKEILKQRKLELLKQNFGHLLLIDAAVSAGSKIPQDNKADSSVPETKPITIVLEQKMQLPNESKNKKSKSLSEETKVVHKVNLIVEMEGDKTGCEKPSAKEDWYDFGFDDIGEPQDAAECAGSKMPEDDGADSSTPETIPTAINLEQKLQLLNVLKSRNSKDAKSSQQESVPVTEFKLCKIKVPPSNERIAHAEKSDN